MVQHRGLFGHLATKFGPHPENLATEALNYILAGSLASRRALIHFLAQAEIVLPPDLFFRTQVHGDDSAIPDLSGVDADARRLVIVEAMFWAGLTEHPPVRRGGSG
jgi:hypothetical protein